MAREGRAVEKGGKTVVMVWRKEYAGWYRGVYRR